MINSIFVKIIYNCLWNSVNFYIMIILKDFYIILVGDIMVLVNYLFLRVMNVEKLI